MSRPSGIQGPLELIGRARDLLTLEAGAPCVLDEAARRATIDGERTITAIQVVTTAAVASIG